ncbi:MAG: PD-(D/E)XK nuclease family protein [Candidatus Pacebacteria bacterium]|nr:PD-(D/E)XK nuclease family protein [Candidatus Paceibacterota bacterium]
MSYVRRYNPNRSPEWNYGGSKWKLSRSKIDLFIECPRCFYIDNKLGTKRPNIPSFNLNIAVDALFKKEFDVHRNAGTPHPLMKAAGIDAVPFAHADMDMWRDNFEGVIHTHEDTGLVVSGAVDDIWQDSDGALIVVDYKATCKPGKIESLSDSSWESQYRRQMGVYQWLLAQKGFDVAKTGYFVYANADDSRDAFENTLHFETTLVPCEGDTDWIPDTLADIKTCLESDAIPPVGDSCEYCPYREAAGKKLLALHMANKK